VPELIQTELPMGREIVPIPKAQEELLKLIPCRKLHGELVPYADFREIYRLLSGYEYGSEDLRFFREEIEAMKAKKEYREPKAGRR